MTDLRKSQAHGVNPPDYTQACKPGPTLHLFTFLSLQTEGFSQGFDSGRGLQWHGKWWNVTSFNKKQWNPSDHYGIKIENKEQTRVIFTSFVSLEMLLFNQQWVFKSKHV